MIPECCIGDVNRSKEVDRRLRIHLPQVGVLEREGGREGGREGKGGKGGEGRG